jgi:hypothetical protein
MSGRRTQSLELVLRDRFPDAPEQGKFYYSEEFRTSLHLCACGCGERVVLPIKSAGWTMTTGRNGFSIFPSVGNREFQCRSHYLIREGRVDWLASMSDAAVIESRSADQQHMQRVYKLTVWGYVRNAARRVLSLLNRLR